MKDVKMPKNNPTTQGSPIADRTNHDIKLDKRMNGISNGGGHRSDQTSSKDNARKRETKS
ncbi:MAG: hypothetical protein H7202_14055 [Pedobacter sp.]|nr:hypothetical protein [Pedobacter sp.]